jgi:hypothetical protein
MGDTSAIEDISEKLEIEGKPLYGEGEKKDGGSVFAHDITADDADGCYMVPAFVED